MKILVVDVLVDGRRDQVDLWEGVGQRVDPGFSHQQRN